MKPADVVRNASSPKRPAASGITCPRHTRRHARRIVAVETCCSSWSGCDTGRACGRRRSGSERASRSFENVPDVLTLRAPAGTRHESERTQIAIAAQGDTNVYRFCLSDFFIHTAPSRASCAARFQRATSERSVAHEPWNAATARTTMSRNFGIHTLLSARDARQHNTRAAAPTRFLRLDPWRA